jgi:uroporphyrinogen decarboxylase
MTDCPLLDVLGSGKPSRRPIWLMRQAGRYLPEYREVRARAGSFLKLCYDPALAAEVTMQPLRRYDLDAAILFSDILVVPHAMGLSLDFLEGEGPRLQTVSNAGEVAALASGVGSDPFTRVCETVARVATELEPSVGFIGFCGAPWTVASYMIEGGSSRREKAVGIAMQNPPWFAAMMARLIETSIAYLLAQIAAGVQAVQIFDSWAGDIPVAGRKRVVIDPIQAIVAGVRAERPGFPVIVFARGVGDGHGEIAALTQASCVGVEQEVSLSKTLRAVPDHVSVQGNLAPELLLEDDESVRAGVLQVLKNVPMRRHVFNLGHGIVPQVMPEKVHVLIEAVRLHDEAAAHV